MIMVRVFPQTIYHFYSKDLESSIATSEETHCNGIGLAIVKHIIDQHKGDITVQSQVGEGSTFTIRIPILS